MRAVLIGPDNPVNPHARSSKIWTLTTSWLQLRTRLMQHTGPQHSNVMSFTYEYVMGPEARAAKCPTFPRPMHSITHRRLFLALQFCDACRENRRSGNSVQSLLLFGIKGGGAFADGHIALLLSKCTVNGWQRPIPVVFICLVETNPIRIAGRVRDYEGTPTNGPRRVKV